MKSAGKKNSDTRSIVQKTIAILCVVFFILPSVQAISQGTDSNSNQDLSPSEASGFWIEVIGRGAIQNGVAVPYLIRYGNNGTQDIPAPLIALFSIPVSSDVYAKIGNSDWKSMKDMMILASRGSDEKPEILSPGSSYSIPVRIIAYNNTQFSLVATSLSTSPLFHPPIIESSIDGSCPSPGIPFEFGRSYPSGYSTYDGSLGNGWVHSFDISIERMIDGNIALKQGNSYVGIFLDNGDGTYTSQNGDVQLTGTKENTFVLESKSGTIVKFNPYGFLGSIQDNQGTSISLNYDNQKKLISVQHSSGDIFKFEYTDKGKISRFIDHAGRSTTYSYDTTGQLLTSVTTPDGLQTQYNYVSQNGGNALSSVIYPDNTQYDYKFNENGYLVEQSQNNGKNKIRYAYDAVARTTTITDEKGNTGTINLDKKGQIVSTQSNGKALTRFAYDETGKVSAITDSLDRTSRIDYDSEGNVIAITNAPDKKIALGYEPSSNNIAWIKDFLGRETKFVYDRQDNLAKIIYPDNYSDSFTYNNENLPFEIIDADGKTTKYFWNKRGQITSFQDARGYSSQYSYDPAGNLDKIVDFRGNAITNEYDVADRLIQSQYPDGSTEQSTYDKTGNLVASKNRNGDQISYKYDDSGQLTLINYPSGKKVKVFYDNSGDIVSIEETNENNSIITAYARDRDGQVSNTTIRGLTSLNPVSMVYEYDSSGIPTSLKYPDGYNLHYRYDQDKQLTDIVDDTQHTIVSYKYDSMGQVIQRSLGNGVYTTYEYDIRDRLSHLVNHGSGGKIISEYSYSYNPAGIVTSMKSPDGDYRYSYDNDYQLTKVEYPDRTSVEYEYDAAGNRISVKDRNGKTDYQTNNLDQYVHVGQETFTYDKKGNIASRQMGNTSAQYTWDEDNRLTGINRGDITINYQYDISGRLITKKTGTAIIHYIWDGANLIAETDGDGKIIQRYVYGIDIDEIVLATNNNQNTWVLQDRIGSVTGTLDDRGSTTGQGTYDVYGIPQNSVTTDIPQRFVGMRWDEDAQLYYVRNRWYDPTLGRFVSPDYIQSSLKNQYNYAENSPVTLVDIDGLDPGDPTTLKELVRDKIPEEVLPRIAEKGFSLYIGSKASDELRFIRICIIGRGLKQPLKSSIVRKLLQNFYYYRTIFAKSDKLFNIGSGFVTTSVTTLSSIFSGIQLTNTIRAAYHSRASGWDILHDSAMFVTDLLGFSKHPGLMALSFGADFWDWSTAKFFNWNENRINKRVLEGYAKRQAELEYMRNNPELFTPEIRLWAEKFIESQEVLSEDDLSFQSQEKFSAQVDPDGATFKINPNAKIPQDDIEKMGKDIVWVTPTPLVVQTSEEPTTKSTPPH